MSASEMSDMDGVRETISDLENRILASIEDYRILRQVQMLTPHGGRSEPYRLSDGTAHVSGSEQLDTFATGLATGRKLLGEELDAASEKYATLAGERAERDGTSRETAISQARLEAANRRLRLAELSMQRTGGVLDEANRNRGVLNKAYDSQTAEVSVTLSDEVPQTLDRAQLWDLAAANDRTWVSARRDFSAACSDRDNARAVRDKLTGVQPGRHPGARRQAESRKKELDREREPRSLDRGAGRGGLG